MKLNRKIPGSLPPPPKLEIDGKITNLSAKTLPELLELKERQEKLLKNPAFINKLADKGLKIRGLLGSLLMHIKAKQEENDTCEMLKKLHLNKECVENLEWEKNTTHKQETYLDSDDDSDPEDVLHILSQNTSNEKKIKILHNEKPLITTLDLEKIGEMSHVEYVVNKTENNPKPKAKTGQFKPYKTTKTDVHNPEKEIHRKKGKHWEITAATPPPIIHGPAKVLNLDESLKLQQQYNIHLKEVEAKHAADKLLERAGIKMEELPNDTSKFGKYRDQDTASEESDNEGSDKEVHDEEPDRGGVMFTVMN